MSVLFGNINAADSDRVFDAAVGQRVIYDEATRYVNRGNDELDRLLSVLIARNTEEFKWRFKLPGSGTLQEITPDGRPVAMKAHGEWDVAFPLKDFGAQLGYNRVDLAYLTIAELRLHIDGVINSNANRMRRQCLEAIFDNTAETWTDRWHGALTLEPLANGDAVLYPPVVGSGTEAVEDHYLVAGYTAANIADANDPWTGQIGGVAGGVNLINELEEHFGKVSGGSNIVTFINTAQIGVVTALSAYVDVPDNWINVGDNTAVPFALPRVPGRIIGRHDNGSWISVWDHIPATYMFATHLDEEPPVLKRVDPADTGLPVGLTLVSEDEKYPFIASFWHNRYGVACGNRLNGVMLLVTEDLSYQVPTGY